MRLPAVLSMLCLLLTALEANAVYRGSAEVVGENASDSQGNTNSATHDHATAPCSSQKCLSGQTAQHDSISTSAPRTLLDTARYLLSTVSQNEWAFGGNSLAEDLSTNTPHLHQSDNSYSQYSGTADVIGGLRSPDTPALQSEGSGMIWRGKGVAPIITSANGTLVTDNANGSVTIQPTGDAANSNSNAVTYMVVFQDAVMLSKIEQLCSNADQNYGFSCGQIFSKTFKGFSVTTSQNRMEAFLAAVGSMVQYAREDEAIQLQTVSVQDLTSAATSSAVSSGLWGLDRIDQKSNKRDYKYHHSSVGTGVHVYTVDTGINPFHEEFYDALGNSRVGANYSYDTTDYNDCNGHGTHITGTMAGLTYGLAKNATIHSVRVMDCEGEGAMSTIVTGLEWIHDNMIQPAVVLMSIGGTGTLLLDQACQSLVNAGAVVVVAAGNDAEDACLISPARDASVITVAATNQLDHMPSFSDGGACVDILAPGSAILSAYYGSDSGKALMSGTSMAAPHIAGIAALYFQSAPSAQPYQVRAAILSSSTWGAIDPSYMYTDTPNAVGNSLLVDPLVTLCLETGADYVNITESNAKSLIWITVALTTKPSGPVTVSIATADSADRLSVTSGSQVLTFTQSNWATAQPASLTLVRNRAAGWNQFDLDFYVSAPKTSSINGGHHRMTVFDNRLVPGDTANFPALITELPFTGTGDTLEYSNDYHITTCTGASSIADTVGSPDYVYAFKPLTGVTVNASLCESSFDTKLILFKGDADNSSSTTLVSCNDDACNKQSWLQATLTAEVTYFFVVDGYNGAYGTWQFSLVALDNSTVEGSLLSGPYGLAVAGTSSTTTNSSSNTTTDDAPRDPQLLNTAWGDCECNQTMQDIAHNCQGQYNLLPMSQCADTASTPLAYETCSGSCSAASGDHFVYGPWGSCSVTCGGGTQTRTGTCVNAAGAATTGCTNGTFSRGCNSGACEPTAWLVGPWGACSKTCADRNGAGKQTRTVGCYQYPGSNATVLVSDSKCNGTKPSTTNSCNGGTPCTFCSGQRAKCNGHGICSNVKSACVCDSGYSGTYCNVPVSCGGVALADGTCCSYELSKSGTCCEVVDKDMECCDSGVLDAAGVCQGNAISIDYNGQSCTGALDAAGACCAGIVDNFGVCDGYDASGMFQIALGSGGTATQLATALGISSKQVSTSTEDSQTITAGQISVLASPLFPEKLTLRRLQSFGGKAATGRLRPRLLGQSLVDDADTIATIAATTTADASSMVVYNVPADSTTSSAITVATLTFGQAQLLLSEATALQDEILAIAAVAVCGNGVCELGERPNATAAAVNATGGCPEDCYVPYVVCPIPSGSLSMCGGTPRGQCMTSSGQCTCNTGYSGVDCGRCASGYSREGLRCVLASLELPSGKWKWYWILALAVACWLITALLIFSCHQCWRSRQIAKETAAMQNPKLGYASTAAAGQAAVGRQPVMLTASAGPALQPVLNPYYSSSYAPAPGLQQPPKASYTYPGAR